MRIWFKSTWQAGILGVVTALFLMAGCGKEDASYTAAPPAGPNAHPLPPATGKFPMPKQIMTGKIGMKSGGLQTR